MTQFTIGEKVSVKMPDGEGVGKIVALSPYFHGRMQYETQGQVGKKRANFITICDPENIKKVLS